MNTSSLLHNTNIFRVFVADATDNPIRAALQRTADREFFWLFLMTGVVAVGVAFEAPDVFHEFNKWRRSNDSRKNWVPLWSLIGLILVIVGVAGEGIFEGAVGLTDTHLRNFDDSLIADTQLRASTAELDAAKARVETAKLDQDTQSLKTEAATANRIAENEKLARVKLQNIIEPRSLSEADRKLIGGDLRRFSPTFSGRKVKIQSQVGDAESFLFAIEIGNILDRAGILTDSTGIGRMVPVGGLLIGVKVTGPPNDGPFIKTLIEGINVRLKKGLYGEWKSSYTDPIIFVGLKPIAGLKLDSDDLSEAMQ